MAVWFRSSARRLVVFVCILSLMAGWSPVMAGTTGALIGTITDTTSGAPLAGAKVTLTSPSQVASTQTDAKGNFVFASMAPDTYTITIAKDGYDTNSTSGISILADQTLRLPFKLQHSLKNIANVTSRSSMNLVRPGTTTDVYSVSPAVTKAAAPIGGGGGLNNAYSAIAAMPGAFVPNGQMGVNQTVYIRGGYYDQIGYEYDGVPVNRAFDNYPAHSASTLGQQELQIYAGGGGANSNATGLAGFINQVTKTGTFPDTGRASWESALRRSITRPSSKPAVRRRIACSPTTLESAVPIKITGISTTTTARIWSTSSPTTSVRATARHTPIFTRPCIRTAARSTRSTRTRSRIS